MDNLQTVCHSLLCAHRIPFGLQLLYGAMVSSECDIVYIRSLVEEVLKAVYRDPGADIQLGTERISVPPANVGEFCLWASNDHEIST